MSKKLYVGGLAYSTTEDALKSAFSPAGTVESVAIVIDRDSGRSKGFGFVEMSTEEEAKKAIEMLNDQELDGRKLKVNEARPKTDRGFGGNRNGNRGFGNDRGQRRF
ncbi:MAG: RNA-binding protein [Candidatus Margulisbacteria bacterium]|nr:RNA-binding protein [Candidatus Margulisiibacteriota bacterium]